MRTRHLMTAAIIAGMMTACETNQPTKTCIHIDLTSVIENDAKKTPLKEWSKEIRFVPLETNDNILVKYISMVYEKDGKFLVSHGNDRVSIFDHEGKYLHDISSKGEGPTNFISVDEVTLHDDLIYIHETSNRIKAFDWDGNFVKKIELPARVNGLITQEGKEEMLAYVPNLAGDEPLRFYKMKGETVMDSIANPFVYPRAAFSSTFYPEMHQTAGSLKAFIELHSDTLYRVSEDWEIQPYLSIGLGKYQPTRDERYKVVLADIRKNPMNGKLPMTVTGEVNNCIYMYSGYIKQEETFCYNKHTQETCKLLLTYSGNTLGIPEDAAFKPKTILGNKYLVDWEQPDNDENPILVIVEP